MANRKVTLHGNRRLARVFAVLLLVIGIGAATGLGTRASADACAPVDVVVARGTGEPGWLGAVVGDPLYGTLRQVLPAGASAYAVRYPADLLAPSSLSDGTRDMTRHLVEQSVRCPHQRFLLVGYSQGAVVTHGVLGTGFVTTVPGVHPAPPALAPRIAAVLLFGDPLRLAGWGVPGHYAERTGNYCAGGDPVCSSGVDTGAHTLYGWAIGPAAHFAVSRI